MADNPYVNKVEYAGQTLIDITDTTAESNDVSSGKVFYSASGERSVGSGALNFIDDTAGTGDTNKTWSANKLVSEFSKTSQKTSLTVSVVQSAPLTIEKNNCYRVLDIVIINLRIRMSGSVGANNIILQGLPKMYGQTLASGSSAGAIASNKKRFVIDEHGNIIATESLDSSDGVIALSGMYVAV